MLALETLEHHDLVDAIHELRRESAACGFDRHARDAFFTLARLNPSPLQLAVRSAILAVSGAAKFLVWLSLAGGKWHGLK